MIRKTCFFIFLTMILFSTYLFALEPVILTNSKEEYSLGRYLEILEDKGKKWSIQDVISPELSGNFVKSKRETPNFGYTNSAYWVRFKLKNDATGKEWLLEVGYPLLDRIELYIPAEDLTDQDNTGFVVKKTGDLLPFKERELKHQNFLFYLSVGSEKEQTLYLRIESEGSMQMPLTIRSSKNFTEKDHNERIALGLYYGIILAMLLYNLFLFFSLRDWNYLYYVLYIANYGFMQISLSGLAFEYLWPDLPWWNNRAIPFFIAFSILWVSKFSSSFLLAKVHTPRINKLFHVLIGLSGLVMIWSLIGDYTAATVVAGGLTMVFIPAAMSAGLISWRKGYRLAKYFVIAWSILMFGTSVYILNAFGILPNSLITANSMQIGSALEVILLSLALADRINIIRKEKEEAQALAIDNLHKADKLKDEFLANTSHELKTPLNGIIGIADSMIDGATGRITSAQKSRLAMILTSGNRLLYLVNDILDSSRLKHHDIFLQLKPVDLRQIAEMVIILSKPLLAGKSIRLENEIDEGLPPVQGDENRLQQIMHNLISNAIKFTDSGIVKVAAVTVDDHLEITVSDTGIGIPEDKLTGIFQSFRQADASISRVYGGTGLGLSITKQLIELHGGTIRAESSVGKGSQFIFTLPVSREQMEPASKARLGGVRDESAAEDQYAEPPVPITNQLAATDQRLLKILAVDDDPINLQVIVDYLSIKGYKADQVLSGREALKIVEQDHYDLILLDIMMPGMSGYEVCRKLRENHSANELPVIMLTAKDRVSDLVEGLDAGANDYLTKPISKGELLARVKTHLESASFFKELKRLNKNMDGLLKEFSRIAFKIHNSVKNKLESIRNFLIHSIRFHDNEEKLIENLLIANKLIGHCSNESKNILFIIANKKCSIKAIIEEFELQAELSLPGEQMSYSIHRDSLPEERILKAEVVQNLLDLYTELLNNIVKHSTATRVDITVRCENDQMSLLVKDNGVGFNYETEREKKGSYGLKMLEELNQEIGGSLSIDSQSELGTSVKIAVKI